jgi:RNA polymerase sigma-70 factor (ECF subfamily)
MTVPPSTPDLDALLAHSGWVRALARNLVVDPFAAEDAEQQAWVTALENPPKHGGNLRSWWGAVVRSSAGKGWREQKRRREVSHGAAVEEAESGAARPSAVAEKLDTFQRLALAVSQLPEPYRTVIYLRYIEELSVREVAKKQNVPVPTAQSHIQRGLEKLRTTLQENIGAQWRNRCLVFALPLPAAPWLSLGPAAILAMKTKTILGSVAAILALASLAIWAPWSDPEPANNDSLLTAAELESGAEQMAEASLDTTEPANTAADGILNRETQVAAAPTAETAMFDVQVLHAQTLKAAPFAVVHVWDYTTRDPEDYKILRKEKPDALTAVQRFGEEYHADENGFLSIPMTGGRYQITASASGCFAYHWSFEKPPVGDPVELLLREEITLRVDVKNAAGQPVSGARVGFAPEPQAYANFPRREVVTDANGEAVFHHLEADIELDDDGAFTAALMTPSDPPQVQQLPIAVIGRGVLHFTMPQVGSVLVKATTADGIPLRDGIPVILQLSDDAARAAASGKSQVGQYDRFSGSLGLSVMTAYVRDGVAEFSQVGLHTGIAVGISDREQGGYAVGAGTGPSYEGEVVQMTLALAPSPRKIQLQLEDSAGVAISAQRLSTSLSWNSQAGKHFGIGEELQVNDEGHAEVRFQKPLQEARSLLLTTSTIDFQAFDEKPSEISIGVFLASEKMLAAPEQNWTVQHGGEILLGGQVVDEMGEPYAECSLSLGLREDNPSQQGFLSDYWEFETDAEGRFLIEAPLQVDGMHWTLTAHSREFGRSAMGVDIPFSIGDENEVLTVTRPKRLVGRLLVDQQVYLKHLELVLYAGAIGQAGSRYYSLDVNGVTGRFQSRRLEEEAYHLVLRSRGTREVLARLESVLTVATNQDGSLQLPDWDLRGKIHLHHLDVKTSSGARPSKISLRLAEEKQERKTYVPQPLSFLSTSSVLPITIGALGYRNQEVVSDGELEVVLQDGISVQVDFPSELPEASGIEWQVAWAEIMVPQQRLGSRWVGPEWIAVSGSQAHFAVPEAGTWTLLLRAQSGEEIYNLHHSYYARRDGIASIEVGEDGVVQVVALDAEELARVMEEVLAQKE